MSKLIITTLTWNGESKLTKLKESLMPAIQDLDYLWVIKDNCSKDNTLQVTSSWGDRVKTIAYKNNTQNFSQGMNLCFHEASPNDDDYVLLLNNDVVVKDVDSIKKMISIMENDKSVGVVGARLLYTDTDKLQHAGVVFDPKFNAPCHFRLNEKNDSNAQKNRKFQVVTGAVFLTKAEYFKNACKTNKSGINGMDENYHWAFDDVDLSLSIKYNMEKNIVYCGDSCFFHEESASLKKNPANILFMDHNIKTLRNKWSKRYDLDSEKYKKDVKYNLY